MTKLITGVFSLGFLLSKPKTICVTFSKLNDFVAKCQRRANEQGIDATFRGIYGNIVGYNGHFRVHNGIAFRARGKKAKDYEERFNMHIPSEILNIMNDVIKT